jgi:hypothetical protein
MIQKTGIQFYELTPVDTFQIKVTGTGLNYHLVASIDTAVLPLADATPFTVAPQMLNGAGSLHVANLHCFFDPGAAAKANYVIEVLDAAGNSIDTLSASPAQVPDQKLVQLVLFVS